MKVTIDRTTSPGVTVEFHGQRFVHFLTVPLDENRCSVMVHYHKLHEHRRRARVATDEVNKGARRPMSMLYSVNEDSSDALSALVDANDPAMTVIRGILEGDKPEEKSKELLAAAHTAENWPKEFKDTLKLWIQIDDEADQADAEVPLTERYTDAELLEMRREVHETTAAPYGDDVPL